MTRSVWRSEVSKKKISIYGNRQKAEKRTPAWLHSPRDGPDGEKRWFRHAGLTGLIQRSPDRVPAGIVDERLPREILGTIGEIFNKILICYYKKIERS
jgi:hypothetical protein